jgi:hypothetical protein
MNVLIPFPTDRPDQTAPGAEKAIAALQSATGTLKAQVATIEASIESLTTTLAGLPDGPARRRLERRFRSALSELDLCSVESIAVLEFLKLAVAELQRPSQPQI